MPCYKCENGKYRIGNGDCMYTSKKKCQKALAAYYAKRNKEIAKRMAELEKNGDK